MPPHPSCVTLAKSFNFSSLKDFILMIFFSNPPPKPRGRHYCPRFAEEGKTHTFIIGSLAGLNKAKYVREMGCTWKVLNKW